MNSFFEKIKDLLDKYLTEERKKKIKKKAVKEIEKAIDKYLEERK